MRHCTLRHSAATQRNALPPHAHFSPPPSPPRPQLDEIYRHKYHQVKSRRRAPAGPRPSAGPRSPGPRGFVESFTITRPKQGNAVGVGGPVTPRYPPPRSRRAPLPPSPYGGGHGGGAVYASHVAHAGHGGYGGSYASHGGGEAYDYGGHQGEQEYWDGQEQWDGQEAEWGTSAAAYDSSYVAEAEAEAEVEEEVGVEQNRDRDSNSYSQREIALRRRRGGARRLHRAYH